MHHRCYDLDRIVSEDFLRGLPTSGAAPLSRTERQAALRAAYRVARFAGGV